MELTLAASLSFLAVSFAAADAPLPSDAPVADVDRPWTLRAPARQVRECVDGVYWIEDARATKVDDLVAMASTIEDHLAGILGFWEFRGASNASVEGFNNKIRWLIKQAYGYRDFKYFRLNVFDLPNLKARDGDF